MSVAYYSNPHATNLGLVYIFNFNLFNDSRLSERLGSNYDRDSLEDLFKNLGFDPNDIHVKENLHESDLFESLTEIMNFNHFQKYRSLWIFIMTHGCEKDFLYATDMLFHINKVKLALNASTNWIGIPKLLVIQGCRGSKGEDEVLIKGDFCDKGNEAEVKVVGYNVPTTSDTIFFHGCWHGFASFRNLTGATFIRYFVKNMKRHFYSDDIIKIFTKVCQDVGYNFSAEYNHYYYVRPKQMPCFEHSFMSKLHFGLDLKNSEMTHEKIKLERYKMDNQHRGLVLFFYQEDYSLHRMPNQSADRDIERLSPLLRSFGLKVQIEIDKTETEVREVLKTASKLDFAEYSLLMIIFSGHGTFDLSHTNHKFFFKEGFICTNDIFDSFSTVETLIGKPKLFFISACRGSLSDKGSIGQFVLPADIVECVDQSDVLENYQTSSNEPYTIPTTADLLVVFASATDYKSIVDVEQRGSFFLIELHTLLSQLEKEENIMDILYRLNERMAKRTTKDLRAEKQMSFVLSSLMKELYFPKRVQSELSDPPYVYASVPTKSATR